jgi:dTDP-glucose pyrophosphorylase
VTSASITPYTVPLRGSLLDVLRTLEAAATAIVLVIDDQGRLTGTMTDGDVRRALLQGAPLQAPLAVHMQRQFIKVGPEASRAAVLELMRASQIQQVPIVSADGHLAGLHLMREMIGSHDRPNWGVIMAGGQGMRLRPLTETIPKPMIPVAGRPILERLVLHMLGFGIRRIFLAINHLGAVVESHFGDGSAFGCQIDYLRETTPLGTAGALTLLPSVPTHPLVVMNGDLVTQADLGALLRCHEEHGHALTVGVRPYVHTVPFGCVEMVGDRIVQLEEKPQLTRLVNTGIYAVEPDALQLLPRSESSTMPWLVERCIASGKTVGGLELHDDWLDVGQWEQLKQAREGNP